MAGNYDNAKYWEHVTTTSGAVGTWTTSTPLDLTLTGTSTATATPFTVTWTSAGLFTAEPKDPLTDFWKPVISDEDLEALCDKIIEKNL